MATRSPSPAPARGDATRERLLKAAIDVFGRKGFEASTRELAGAADVNLAAIPYHFGGKEGLYLAAAEHIATQVRARVTPVLAEAGDLDALNDCQARDLIQRILEALARIFVDEAAASWARFVIREQMEPSAAFEHLYGGAIGPMFGTLARLIGRVTGQDPADAMVRVQVPRLIGQILIFRAARATVLRELGWHDIGEAEFALIRSVIRASVEALAPLGPAGENPP